MLLPSLIACAMIVADLFALVQTPPQTNPGSRSDSRPRVGEAREHQDADEALRLNRLGVAYMNQQKFELALRQFSQSSALDSRLREAELNQGIALLNLQRLDAARELLLKITRQHPDDARAWYNLGLLYRGNGQYDNALDAFQHAANLAAGDADTWYFVGLMHYDLHHDKEAVVAFERTLKLDAFHASAHFGLARAYRQAGNAAKANRHLAEFQRLTQTKLGAPIGLAYGDQGPLSLAAESAAHVHQVDEPIRLRFSPVSLPGPTAFAPVSQSAASSRNVGRGACVLDYDNDGKPDMFLAAGGRQGGMALLHNVGQGNFEDVTKAAGLDSNRPALACAAGDYDNDGFPDLVISGEQSDSRVAVYHNDRNGTFKDVAAKMGITASGRVSSLLWVDYDHEGDLDLYISGRTPAMLWRNNGNRTFTDVTAETGLGDGASTAVLSDYNNDRAIDLIVTGASTRIFTNPREGKWSASAPWTAAMPATQAVAVLDFNKDGWMDLGFTHDGVPGISLWRNVKGRSFERVDLPDLHWERAWGVIAVDYDNDGWIDLAALGETAQGRAELRILRNEGQRGFRDVSAQVGLENLQLNNPRTLVAVEYDGDGDAELLITQAAGPAVLLRNDGGNQNHLLRIGFQGLADNKSAIGTKVEVFAGDLWQKFEISGATFFGQSSTDLLVGVGKRQQADVARMLWPTGVIQDETQLAANQRLSIAEIDRRGSSCPVLFAWDGARYRFISDMLGAGVIGHWVGPGERNVPDPSEYLKLEGVVPQLRNRRLSFRLMEPMEEVVYLDQVRLLAIDHPVGVDVYPNEYFASNPPFPEYKVITSRNSQTPAGAWDDHGNDVTRLLAVRDHQYVAGFDLLPFKGFSQPHSLVLDLGEPYHGGPLRLLMHGYIEYFTATSMFAAHQAGVNPVAPYVEALDSSGKWARIVDDMGFPAGLPRTTVADLTGKVPLGSRRVRITTNLQIYWDQILIDRTPSIPIRATNVPLAEAGLHFHGFPRAIERGTPGDLDYIYEEASATGPYTRPMGAYTRLGAVTDLLLTLDDRFVVFGSGDEVSLEFDPATLPSLPSGWKRDFFFYADGYEKDMDFYAADFLSVSPMPFHGMKSYPYAPATAGPADTTHLHYMLDYNTRFYSDRASAREYRFRFTAKD